MSRGNHHHYCRHARETTSCIQMLGKQHDTGHDTHAVQLEGRRTIKNGESSTLHTGRRVSGSTAGRLFIPPCVEQSPCMYLLRRPNHRARLAPADTALTEKKPKEKKKREERKEGKNVLINKRKLTGPREMLKGMHNLPQSVS